MKLLDRYILRQFLSTYVFVVALLLAVITVIDLTEKTDKYAKAQLGFVEILGYYGNFLPWIAGLITPITVFIATVYVTAKMAGHTEIVAILSSGVSFRRLLLPYFIGAALIAGVSFWLNGWIIPNSNKSRLAFELEYLKPKTNSSFRNIHMQVSKNVFLYLQSYNSSSDKGYQFTLERFKNRKLIEKLTARRIEWDTTKNKWTLYDWEVTQINDIFEPASLKPDSTQKVDSLANPPLDTRITKEILKTGKTPLDTTLAIHPNEFDNDYRKYDGLTLTELNKYIKTLKSRGSAGIDVYEVEKYTRFASPFSIFILTFMGVIVSSRKSRGGTGAQIALGFALSFVFILFFMMFRTFAEAGSLPPAISVWIPAIIFGAISGVMYRYVPR
ncbi:MAG TPA: LptF/LptG family permease [Cyclobacteriaceae bacterium]|nr:LptF/LptG family permease [Cyclobacteriaceae bacterium]HMV08358.1 LptF/LptG family permease [Cyclobacteriaceae bacterium]HMV88365.1 LptF/LptG family permease [Cyclobacteriaceae bacterium]HMX02201.1 LptF/LptG family permease [Cyclobacteriaceae bacterium]HMX52260.1 LptF/LptG family permease [Cyclobacteriaceae bacterium]